jgi:hypothetical protein
VDEHRNAVRRALHVDFHAVRPMLDCEPQRDARVLGRLRRSTSVRDKQRKLLGVPLSRAAPG